MQEAARPNVETHTAIQNNPYGATPAPAGTVAGTVSAPSGHTPTPTSANPAGTSPGGANPTTLSPIREAITPLSPIREEVGLQSPANAPQAQQVTPQLIPQQPATPNVQPGQATPQLLTGQSPEPGYSLVSDMKLLTRRTNTNGPSCRPEAGNLKEYIRARAPNPRSSSGKFSNLVVAGNVRIEGVYR